MEEKIGKVTHFFNKLGVAAIEIESGKLQKGDRLHILGHTTDVETVVDSMEIEHRQVEEALPGQNVGIRVDMPVREHDQVYKVFV